MLKAEKEISEVAEDTARDEKYKIYKLDLLEHYFTRLRQTTDTIFFFCSICIFSLKKLETIK